MDGFGPACTIREGHTLAGMTGVVFGLPMVIEGVVQMLVRLDARSIGSNLTLVPHKQLSIDDYPDARTGEIRHAGDSGA